MVADTSNKIRGARDGAAMLASVSALLNTGRLVRVIPGPCNPGEPGSGYTSAASIGHVEPEEIFVLGTTRDIASLRAFGYRGRGSD